VRLSGDWGEQGPHLTRCSLGRRLPPYQVASRFIQPFGHNSHVTKSGSAVPIFRGSCIPIQHNVVWTEAYLRTKWHPDTSSCMATTDMGRKLGGGCAPLTGAGTGSPCNTMSPGQRSTSLPSGILIHPAVWPQQTLVENWGLCPFGGRGAGSPSNTMWPQPRSTSMSILILIRPMDRAGHYIFVLWFLLSFSFFLAYSQPSQTGYKIRLVTVSVLLLTQTVRWQEGLQKSQSTDLKMFSSGTGGGGSKGLTQVYLTKQQLNKVSNLTNAHKLYPNLQSHKKFLKYTPFRGRYY